MKTCSISLILVFISILDVQSENVCPQGTWGDNCASLCTCDANTEICNPETGACSCKSGWQGAACNIDIDECANDSILCLGNSFCQNTAGSFICQCNIGYSKASDGSCQDTDECASDLLNSCPENAACQNTDGSFSCQCNTGFSVTTDGNCQECDGTHYGVDCAKVCPCNTANTESCDSVFGTCTCNVGWGGETCSDDVDECTTLTDPCNDVLKNCNNTKGSFTCICKKGYRINENLECIVCPQGTWGDNCALQCTCGANTETCNPETGACSCKSGWQGDACNIDIDECADASVHQCPENSECQNTDGSYICQCNIGYSKASDRSCQESSQTADEDFQTVNAESSNTYQQQCSALRKNGYVVIKGRPCKIDSVSMLEHRKHGHAKVRIVGLDIFTGEKFKDVCQPTHEMDVPIISLTDFQLTVLEAMGEAKISAVKATA